MFNISFLNSGVLFLTSAILVPLLIYLFARKRPRKLVFSSIRFIKESQKRQKKRINLKNILLLIIRMLIILLTILAISRPSIRAPFLKRGILHPKTALAVILDNSYSMDYLVDTRTELEKGKGILFRMNEIISENDLTVLLTLDSNWNNLYGRIHYGRLPRELVAGIKLTPKATALSDIINTAESRLKESHLPNKEIYFITDLQEYQLPDKFNISTYFLRTSPAQPRNNISCQNARVTGSLIGKQLTKNIAFDLVNHSDEDQEDVIFDLYLDGSTLAEKVTDLKGRQRKTDIFTVNLEDTGWHEGFVQVRNERLSYDNRSYFSFYFNRNPQVAVCSNSLGIPPTLDTILEIYCNDRSNITILDPEQVNPDSLLKYDNYIFYNYQKLNPRIDFILEKLQSEEKNIMFIADRDLNKEWQDQLSLLFDIKFHGFSASSAGKSLDFINRFHPLTADIIVNRDIPVSDYWNVQGGSNILLQAGEYPLAIENNNNILWLFDVNSLSNAFLLDAAYPIFAYNCLQYTTSEGKKQQSFLVNNTIRLNRESLRLPDGSEIYGAETYSLRDIGIYHRQQAPFSVNLDYSESQFKVMEPAELNNLELVEENWEDHFLQSRYGFEIWKYLLILVLMLLALEMFIIKKEESQ
ncbi:MAG: BatA and WFA domain-containing protein [Candidatus Cloacimonetes bacterium]|nr:BatA and WFA domain-containing protein [Candidatus Cloacimonadota bacterium]